ncbi:MAG: DUF839 domain-containing protein [Anaerolineae bacterium]|nr:DUF839 domain-containing protein [Anaerolineae bacterium]
MKAYRMVALTVLALIILTITVLTINGNATAQSKLDPLPSMVAVTFVDGQGTGAANAVDYVKALVDQYRTGELSADFQFPLENTYGDTVRALDGFNTSVVVSWLDPLTEDESAEAPRFGANNDYIAYFGEGWEEAGTPYFQGSGDAAWVWVNHEYISNAQPTAETGPTGQHLTLAKFLNENGLITAAPDEQVWSEADLATYTNWYQKQLGGTWMRIVKDPETNTWSVDRTADNMRYDATSDTLAAVVGYEVSAPATDDAGQSLPEGVVPGIMADCSGGTSPWGTIFTAEENSQDYYGDAETCWTSSNAFIPEAGCDAGDYISLTLEPSEDSEFGSSPAPGAARQRDYYGFLTEIDPGVAPANYYESAADGGDGVGHRKMGTFGRVRWENVTFVTDENFQLIDGQPIVMYGANDRRGGRMWKFVSSEPYTAGMTTPEIRALLDDGTVYVAHLAGLDANTGFTIGGEVPTESTAGQGQWLEISLESEDIAPNAAALGDGTETIGEALQDVEWNNIGGFETDNDVLSAHFTAATKVGVKETNRPEDLEWNPADLSGTPRLYVAFTNHGRPNALDDDGVMYDPELHDTESVVREDPLGSIFILEEADPANPAESTEFTYWAAWTGTEGVGPFDAANPDNLMIDADGGVWFGTDGNFGRNGTADGVYYLDMNPNDATGANPTFGVAFRVAAGPSDSEATGPALSADMGTIFFNVQHPGEAVEDGIASTWPQVR